VLAVLVRKIAPCQGCNPGATFAIRSLLKIVGQYSFSRLFAAPNAIRKP